MNYTLIPVDAGAAQPIALVRPVLLIGRHPECDVRINSSKISRRHCCLALAYDRVMIRDLGSHNGLRVNGRVVDEARLFADDEVAIGPFIYRMVVEPEQSGRPGKGHPGRPSTTPDRPGPGQAPAGSLPDDIELVPIEERHF